MPEYRRADVKGGTYFFTVNTHRRQPILTETPVRLALREGIQNARERFPFEIRAWVLLPDHLHCIWKIPDGDAEFAKRWGIIKRYVSSRCAIEFNEEAWLNDPKPAYGSAATGNIASATTRILPAMWNISTGTQSSTDW